MAPPRIEGEWLVVDCEASSVTPVWIAVGDGEFTPAFRDYTDGARVAKIRNPGITGRTQLRVRIGDTTTTGTVNP